MRPLQPPPPAGSAANRTICSRRGFCSRQGLPDLTLPLPQRDPLAVPLLLPPTSASSSSAPAYSELENVRRIGSGAGGTVYSVLHPPTGNIYALKVIYGNHEDAIRNQMRDAIEILSNVDHPNVVKCHNLVDHNGEIQLLLEYMDNGSLKGSHITDERHLSRLARQILSGLYYLHRNHIVHRDIKPSNLLINSRGTVKLADFGTSRVLAQTMDNFNSSDVIAYMSPERIDGQDTYNSDIWSLGMSILEVYMGRFPLEVGRQGDWGSLLCAISLLPPPEAPPTASKEFRDFIDLCLRKNPDSPTASKEFRDFIDLCLRKNPDSRWPASHLLNHRFIKKYDQGKRKRNEGLDTKEEWEELTDEIMAADGPSIKDDAWPAWPLDPIESDDSDESRKFYDPNKSVIHTPNSDLESPKGTEGQSTPNTDVSNEEYKVESPIRTRDYPDDYENRNLSPQE